MTVLYKLAQEQLSKQYHYDFGLRALKSVLVMAGDLKRSSPDLPEDVVLMRALRDMNLPKFVYKDVPLFLGLINDLFPGLDCPRVRYPEFNDAVEESLAEQGMILLDSQVDKVSFTQSQILIAKFWLFEPCMHTRVVWESEPSFLSGGTALRNHADTAHCYGSGAYRWRQIYSHQCTGGCSNQVHPVQSLLIYYPR